MARQIATGSAAAHDAGIVHRDLKPANIKVHARRIGEILDFGLAKASSTTPPLSTRRIRRRCSPIAPPPASILGTAAYMSPEQARGQPVDKRADIWAFGCVLYEMLTGARAFAGDTTSDILAAVIDARARLVASAGAASRSRRAISRGGAWPRPRPTVSATSRMRGTISSTDRGSRLARGRRCDRDGPGPSAPPAPGRSPLCLIVAGLALAALAAVALFDRNAPASGPVATGGPTRVRSRCRRARPWPSGEGRRLR